MQSYYICKKSGLGNFYKFCADVPIKFIYKVFLCDEICCEESCKKCHEKENKKPIQEGEVEVILHEHELHDFIINTLINSDIRRGSAMTFVLSPEDSFEDVGVVGLIAPNQSLCCYLEEPAI